MKYQLIASGHLLVGSKEKECIARIQQITQLPEEQVWKSLLNGTPKKLLSSDNKGKIKKAALALRQAGLEVTIKVRQPASTARTDGPGDIAPNKEKGKAEKERIDSLPPSLTRKKTASAKKKFRFRRLGRSLALFLLLLITLASGAIGYAWHWLYRPLPNGVAAAEQALFDGNLVMAGLVDVKKLIVLEQYWFGELDLKALPFNTQQQRLLNNLLSGAPEFRENLTHILYSASTSADQHQGTHLVLLAGKFEEKSLLKTLDTFFHVEKTDKNRWQLNPLTPSDTDSSCAENMSKTGEKGLSLQISPNWLMLFTDPAYADHIWGRLSSGQEAKQDLSAWYTYRKGKFISFMVVTPTEAGKAIKGIPGMMAQGALAKTPQVQEVAFGLEAHALKGGLNANIHLASTDAGWNASAAAAIEKKLITLQKDTRSVTPTLEDVLSRIKTSGKADGLDIDIRMDTKLLHDLSQVTQEGISSGFTAISGGNTTQGGTDEQKILKYPFDFKAKYPAE